MTRQEAFLSSFDPMPQGVSLPPELAGRYQPESCLSQKRGGYVLRVRRRCDGLLCVMKAAPSGAEDLARELHMLERLAPLLPGQVPQPVELYQDQGMAYLLRTYLPGETLAQFREREGACPEETCVSLGQKLCALLQVLHSQQPPIIHRDIKPENMILLPNGQVGLIDFGIARQYKSDRESDTCLMGSRSTAAPEQYGYAQTDCRTDLYALGMTLIWLLTGAYHRDGLAGMQTLSPGLRQTLERAVALDPRARFQTAAQFSAALAGRRPGRRRGWRLVPAAAVCALAVLGVAWAIASAPTGPKGSDEVAFDSLAMEAAVRQALNKPEGAVTYGELADVEHLAVVGMTTFGPEESFDYNIGCYIDGAYQAQPADGDISDLSLLEYMPNLTQLYLCCQEIKDISVLADLPLTTVALCENEIMDLSPLAGLTEVETLFLGGNPATDYSVLSGLTRLKHLVVEGSAAGGVAAVDSLAFLNSLNLQVLGLGLVAPRDGDWQPLTTQVALDELLLWDPPEAAVAAAASLSGLKRLTLADYFAPDLTGLRGMDSLEVLNVHKGSLERLDGVESLTRLITLAVGFSNVSDLSPLIGLQRLNYIQLETLPITDFSPLAQLPALGYVVVNEEQAPMVEADCPGYTFQLRTN